MELGKDIVKIQTNGISAEVVHASCPLRSQSSAYEVECEPGNDYSRTLKKGINLKAEVTQDGSLSPWDSFEVDFLNFFWMAYDLQHICARNTKSDFVLAVASK